jgi:hypothetical protein
MLAKEARLSPDNPITKSFLMEAGDQSNFCSIRPQTGAVHEKL